MDGDAVKVSLALRTVIDTTELNINDSHAAETAWRENFKTAIREVLTGFQSERSLLESKRVVLSDWMRVRMVTISGEENSTLLLSFQSKLLCLFEHPANMVSSQHAHS